MVKNDLDLSRSQLVALIDEWILSERDRAILKRRLLDGIVYEKLAEEFDLTPRQVQKIIKRTSERLFKHVEFDVK